MLTFFRKTTRHPPVLGIPVLRVHGATFISETWGLWPWKRIALGDPFFSLEPRAQGALLLHEAAHAKLFHLEWRILFAITNFWRPAAVGRYCRAQEFQADAFAAECGYGRELALVFSRIEGMGGPFHPKAAERIERIFAHLRQSAIL